MQRKNPKITAVIVPALVVPLALAESLDEEDVREGTPKNQYTNESPVRDEDPDARKHGQTEQGGSCGAAD